MCRQIHACSIIETEEFVNLILYVLYVSGTKHSMEKYSKFERVLGYINCSYGPKLRLRNVAYAAADVHATSSTRRHQICKSLFIPYHLRSI